MKRYGLVGFPLSHSFSPNYFQQKFKDNNILDACYESLPLENIANIRSAVEKSGIDGFNITVPHKESVIPFLDHVEPIALKIGAVNTVKVMHKPYATGIFKDNLSLTGYNTDAYGFRKSVESLLPRHCEALILGDGGGAKAVKYVFDLLDIKYSIVSRTINQVKTNEKIASYLKYSAITKSIIKEALLIVNTTPVGMYPNINDCPKIPYNHLTSNHILFDLVYNPEETKFLEQGKKYGAKVKNGYEMLCYQADKSWEIWTKEDARDIQNLN